ncbi:hypothetical protein ACK3TF_001213 [Chlorella vulgaris]
MATTLLLAEDVLLLAAHHKQGDGVYNLIEATPGAPDCGAVSLKRQRRFDRDHSRRSTVSNKPAQAAAASLAQPLSDLPWAASYLFSFVHQCLSNLGSLHDACRAIQEDTKAAKLAHAYLRREPMARALLLRERTLGGAMLAASLWLAIKFEATRPTTPDANLMSRISGIPAGLLRQQERQILADLQWDLMTPAREAGAVAPPDLTDDVCLDQQKQLAALAVSTFADISSDPSTPPPAEAACPMDVERRREARPFTRYTRQQQQQQRCPESNVALLCMEQLQDERAGCFPQSVSQLLTTAAALH